MKARIADIVAIASDITGYRTSVITGRSRKRYIARVRQAVYYVAREQGHSYPEIGRRLGRDHSSVLAGRQTAMAIMERDPRFARLVEALARRAGQVRPFGGVALTSRQVPLAPCPPPALFELDGPAERGDRLRKAAFVKGSAELAGALARAMVA